MNPKTKELLSVLDLSEEEQYRWVDTNVEQEGWEAPISKSFVSTESIADLAFRLRDEVKDLPDFVFSKAWHLIVAKCMYKYNWGDKEWKQNFEEFTGSRDAVPNSTDREIFALWDSKPIHWIVTALIAKELEKSNDKQT